MTLTAIVSIRGAYQPKGTLAAFAGSDVRGTQSSPIIPLFGPHTAVALYQAIISHRSSTADAQIVPPYRNPILFLPDHDLWQRQRDSQLPVQFRLGQDASRQDTSICP